MSDQGWTTGAACPPGTYRPAPLYDCRPVVGGQAYLQEDLRRTAAQYVDDAPAPVADAGLTQPLLTAQFPAATAATPVSSGSVGGIDSSTLLLIVGAILIFFVMKK